MAIRVTKDLVALDGSGGGTAKKQEEQKPKTSEQPTATTPKAPAVTTPKAPTEPAPKTPKIPQPSAITAEVPRISLEEQKTARKQTAEELAAQGRYDEALEALQGAQDKLGAAALPRAESEQELAARAEYERAMAALRGMEGTAPTYSGGLDKEIGDLYAKITGRGDFQYDLNEDAMWQQLKDDYTRLGKQSMQDTMGQAAALTGGYGSSYGQMAGQAAYDRYLTQLSERAPELYDRAYQRYRDEGDELWQNLSFLMDRDATAYGRFQDEYNRYLADRSYNADRADSAYARMSQERGYADERYDTAYQRALQELGLAQDRESEAYSRAQRERSYADERSDLAYERKGDSRDLLLSLMEIGYTPTAQEIAEAGLSQAQADALTKYYKRLLQPAPSGGGGSYSGGTEKKTTESGKAPDAVSAIWTSEEMSRYHSPLSPQPLGDWWGKMAETIADDLGKAESREEAEAIWDRIPETAWSRMSDKERTEIDRALRRAGL